MKIVEYLGGLDVGGAESIIKDYAVMLTRLGHEVIVPVYYSTPYSPNQIALEKEHIRIDIIRGEYSSNILKRGYNKVLSFLDYDGRYVKKLLHTEKPDVVHLHGYVLKDFKHISKELEKVRLFYTCHSVPEKFFTGEWRNQFDIAKRLIEDYNMRLIALHRKMADELNEMFQIDNTMVLNNPVNIGDFDKVEKTRKDVRRKLDIPEDCYVIGNVGRFHTQKNHIFIVDVFNAISKINPKAYLLLVSSSVKGNKKEIIERLNGYGLLGKYKVFIDYPDMQNIYAAMDVFFLPSLWEGLSLAFLEAQVAGLPCVISENVSKDGVVSENVISLSLDESIEKWTRAIMFQDGKKIKRYRTMSEFDINTIISDLLDLYCDKNKNR